MTAKRHTFPFNWQLEGACNWESQKDDISIMIDYDLSVGEDDLSIMVDNLSSMKDNLSINEDNLSR